MLWPQKLSSQINAVRTTTFIVKILLLIISNLSESSFTGTQNHIQSSRQQERKELKRVTEMAS